MAAMLDDTGDVCYAHAATISKDRLCNADILKSQCSAKFSCSATVRYRSFVISHVWLPFLDR